MLAYNIKDFLIYYSNYLKLKVTLYISKLSGQFSTLTSKLRQLASFKVLK